MNDPDNPFQPRSKEEIMHDLEILEQQIKEGKYKTAEEVFAELETELKNGSKS